MTSKESRHFRKGERAYDLNNDYLPVYIGEGLGNLDYKDAIDLSVVKRTTLGLPAAKEYISAITPPPERSGRQWNASQTSRASKITLTFVSIAATRQPVVQIWSHI